MRIWIVTAITPLVLGACSPAEPHAPKPAAPKPAITATPAQSPVVAEPTPESGHRWHTAAAGKSVQYGVPDSDDRLLRIDCGEGGRIEIGGPAGVDDADTTPITATFGDGDAARRLPVLLAEAGDGMNFYAEIGPDDPALQTLLAGRTLKVTQGEYSWDVPGAGAAAELKPFIEACRAAVRTTAAEIH